MMLDYLWSLVASLAGADTREEIAVAKWSFSGLVAVLSAAWGTHVMSFLQDPMFVVVTILWALDWVLGSALAIRERRWRSKRGTYSIVKWLVWMCALAVGWGFRLDGLAMDDFVPTLIGAAICFTEGTSILRNGAALAGKSGWLLGRVADNLEGEAEAYTDKWRASLRRRRGQCEFCGRRHPPGDASCPSCGAPDRPQLEGPAEGPSAVPGGDQP